MDGRRTRRLLAATLALALILPALAMVPPAHAAARCLLPPVMQPGERFLEPLGGTSEGEAATRALVVAVRIDGRRREFRGSAGSEPDGQGWLIVQFRGSEVGRWRYTFTTSQGAEELSRCTGSVRVVGGAGSPPDTAKVDPPADLPTPLTGGLVLGLAVLAAGGLLWPRPAPARTRRARGVSRGRGSTP